MIKLSLLPVGGPKQLKSEHLRSGGNKFDSIIAILYNKKKCKTFSEFVEQK